MFISYRSKLLTVICFIVTTFSIINYNISYVSAKEVGQDTPYTKEELLLEVNAVRSEAGLPSFVLQVDLEEAAKLKGMYMTIKNYFDHWSPDGAISPWNFLNLVDYKYKHAGENLAINYGSANEVVEAMMASPKHRDNLLGKQDKDIGIEVYQGTYLGRSSTLVIMYFGTKL
jgi:uncharacterized protein YkwD